MGSVNTFPRAVTIAVPDSIRPEFIGDYVSDLASKLIKGTGGIVPRTASLRPLGANLWVLTFELNNAYELSPSVEIRYPHAIQYTDVEAAPEVAARSEERPVGTGKRKGAGR
jgi:hypothetical protein